MQTLIVGMGIISFIYIYSGLNIKKKHGALQMLFMTIGLTMVVLTSSIMISLYMNNADATARLLSAALKTNSIVLYVVVAYTIVTFMISVVKEAMSRDD